MSFVLALAAGVMLSATIFEFWLPALASASLSAGLSVLFSMSLGIVFFLALSKYTSDPDFAEADIETHTGDKREAPGKPWHVAKVLLLSLTLHNFPEGFAVAVSSLGSDSLSFNIALAVAMHNIPEGIAIAVPVFAATGSRRKALKWTFASGMAEPAGAVLALLVLSATGILTHIGIGHLLCVVGGVMFAVAFTELLPGAWSYGKPLSFVTGLVSGFLIMLVTIFLGA
jgi:ZIP family zinc transporter